MVHFERIKWYILNDDLHNVLNQNNQANTQQRIQIAFAVEQKRLTDLLQEYAYWDEAHDKLIKSAELDEEWLASNVGEYLYEAYGVEIVLAGIAVDKWLNKPQVSLYRGQEYQYDFNELLDNGLRIFIQKKQDDNEISPYFVYDKRLYMISVMSFHSETTEEPVKDGSYLLLAKPIDENFLAELADLYKLPELKFALATTAYDEFSSLSFDSPMQHQLRVLYWEHESYFSYMSGLIAFVALVGLVNVIFARYVFLQENNNRKVQQQQLVEAANEDYLTGISNRRAFIKAAENEIKRAARNHSGLTLMLLDLDHFKRVNDTFGHQVGDRVLQAITQAIKASLRQYDIFARFGGEEFVVLLPDSSEALGVTIAERICERVAQTKIDSGTDIPLYCTVSIGVVYRAEDETLDSLMSRVDKALYEAKDNGRNQYKVA